MRGALIRERPLTRMCTSTSSTRASATWFHDRKLMGLDLIVPHWTMGKITPQQLNSVLRAVQSGVGIAGCHGGMCDAFRDAPDWHFMTGGQWVAHPGDDGTRYSVRITDHHH